MIGKALKYMRKQKQLKQEQIGLLINVRGNTITQYENEKRNPTFETIEKIANNCGYKIFFVNEETKDKFQVKDLIRKDI